MNNEHYALLASGKKYYYRNPAPDQILIQDVASGLSKECRFNGQCRSFYSVAQHSVLVSYIVPPKMALHGLLHDAHEAYLKDLPSPLKRSMDMTSYDTLVKLADGVIFEKFNTGVQSNNPAVKRADLVALATEKRDLMPHDDSFWPCLENIKPLPMRIEAVGWLEARHLFMQRFNELYDTVNNRPRFLDKTELPKNVIPLKPKR